MQQLSRTFIVASLAIASLAVIPTGAAAATSDRSGFGAISAEAVRGALDAPLTLMPNVSPYEAMVATAPFAASSFAIACWISDRR